MHPNAGNSEYGRRNVLKAATRVGVGAGAIVTAGASAVTAIPPCAVADGDDGHVDVYAECGADLVDKVPNGETGETVEVCSDDAGSELGYIVWDGDWTDGWVYTEDISSCDPA